ncbi:unnamed protein product [Polarella glacialis]|uniref:XPG N-terminal domain-containing protein n=1 Tax=Polarella glacialis TaxID=89957 RepID=A0A813HGT8_POLGL|nr:unnamed protein product [Polarella glacialis]
MGILRLLPFLRTHCGHVVRPLHPEDLKGKRVWVDVHGPLYRCAYRSPGNSQGITRNFLAFSERLEAFGMQPIFVFDSAPKPAKVEHTLIERARKRNVQQARCQKDLEDLRSILGQLEELGARVPHNLLQRKYNKRSLESHFARRAIAIPADAYQMVKDALTQRGSKVILARSGDAEEEAAKSSGPEDLVASEDLDALIYGAPSVLRFIDRLGADMEFDPEDVRVPSLINLSEVMAGLGFTKHKQLVDFAILCGCDFATKLKGIGPIHAHRIILKHGSIGRFRMAVEGKQIPWSAWAQFDFQAARDAFLRPLPKRRERSSKGGGQVCKKRLPSLTLRSLANAQHYAASHGGQAMMASDGESGQMSQTLRWQCSEGHQWDAKFVHLKCGNRWCPTCREMLSQQARLKELQGIASKQGGKVLSEK